MINGVTPRRAAARLPRPAERAVCGGGRHEFALALLVDHGLVMWVDCVVPVDARVKDCDGPVGPSIPGRGPPVVATLGGCGVGRSSP